MGWPLGWAEGSLAIWSSCLWALLFLASASWASGTDSRAFLSPSLSPPWQQTSSKQTCLGSCGCPSHCPQFTGEGDSAQRGCLGNYRETTKQDLNPDPCFPRGRVLSHAWHFYLVSSPEVSVTRGHRQPPIPPMCSPVSGTRHQDLHVLSTGKVEGGSLLTQEVGLTKGHMARVNATAEVLLLVCSCRE